MRDLTVVAVAALVATVIVCPQRIVWAADKTAKIVNELFLDAQMKEISKRQAVRILLNDDKAIVLRCSTIELSDKMSIRKKK
jgi:hypothetical protein